MAQKEISREEAKADPTQDDVNAAVAAENKRQAEAAEAALKEAADKEAATGIRTISGPAPTEG